MLLWGIENSSMSSRNWHSSADVWNSSMSTDSSADPEESSLYSHPLYTVSHYIWMCASPVILLVGNLGNVLTILIMARQRSGEAVVNVYFMALAINDLVLLDIVFVDEWIGMSFGYYIHFQSDLLCKLRNWIGGTTAGTGAWFLASLTAHRAMSVVWPHRINALCTRRMVVGVLVAMHVFLAVVYTHFLYGYHVQHFDETNESICILMQGSYVTFIQEIFTYIDMTIYCLLPFVCICLANSVLVWKLRASVQQVRHQFAEKESVAARERAASSVTVTILTVSVAFLVLTLPVSVYFISLFIFDYSGTMSVHDQARSYLIRAVTFMLMYLNSSVNFYLYCLTGARFRREFLNLFCSKPSLS